MIAEPMTIAAELPSQAPTPSRLQIIPADDDGVKRTLFPLPSFPPSFMSSLRSLTNTDASSVSSGGPASSKGNDDVNRAPSPSSVVTPSGSRTDTSALFVSSGEPAFGGDGDVDCTPSPSTVPSPEPTTDTNDPPGELAPGTKTTYHIYHSGKLGLNFHIYTEPDSSLKKEGVVTVSGGHCSGSTYAKLFKGAKRKRVVRLDDPKSDPRTPAYFLHSPRIWGRIPPQTLRYGGGKDAPVVCLIHGWPLWIKWKLEFAPPEGEKDPWTKKVRKLLLWGQMEKDETGKDETERGDEADAARVDSGFSEGTVVQRPSTGHEEEGDNRTSGEMMPLRRPKSFNDPGVFDRRGVLSSKYPLRSFGLLGETGRQYIREQKELRRWSTNEPASAAGRDSAAGQPTVTVTRAASAPHPVDDGGSPPPLPPHMFPDSLNPTSLILHWKGMRVREYTLSYRGISLRWKGTGTVRDPNMMGSLLRFNHLKLVAYLPLSSDESESALRRRSSRLSLWNDSETKDKRDVVLATYTCLWSKRKAGRLEVYELGLKQTVAAIDTAKKEADDETEAEKLRHVVVATGLCMMQGEKEKRDRLKECILEAAQAPSS